MQRRVQAVFKKEILYKLTILCFLVSSFSTYAQLDSIHYLPPLKQVSNNAAIQQQVIYLSTPVPLADAFSVEVYRGNTLFTTITGLAKGAPKKLDSSNGLANGDNNITLVTNARTGTVLNNAGLRFESPSGKKFYVNYRGRSSAQAGSLTSKGTKSLGTDFRWGGIPNRATNANLSTSLGMMASENGTVVTVSGYDTNCEFRSPVGRGAITANTLTINLDAGESYVIEAALNQTTANVDGWLGATISATKPIAISNGGLNVGVRVGQQSRDVGIDQPVPTNLLGKEYLFVRGNGPNESEFPIIVATQDGTRVYANGTAATGGTLIGTINDGDYIEIPGSYYSGTTAGANMYVTTSKAAYAYQCLTGKANAIQTIGMNFLVPLICLLPNKMDEISEINDIAGIPANTAQSGITIIASTSTPDANIIVRENDIAVALPAPVIPAGTTEWKTFFVTGLSGRVSVSSSGPIAVGTFLTDNSNAGLAGYFSGYDTVPTLNVAITGGGCLGDGVLEESSGDTYDAYQWYKDGVAIAGATAKTYNPTQIGDYYIRVTEGTCSYDSSTLSVYYCYPDIHVTKEASVTEASDGDTITYTVTVESLSLQDVTGIVITESFPSQLNLISANPSFGSWTSPDWTIGTMTSGQIHTLTIVAEVPGNATAGNATNSVSITQTPPQTLNDTPDVLDVTVDIIPIITDLSLTKTVNTALLKVNDIVIFNITIKNNSTNSVSDIQVKDKLPTNLTYSATTTPPMGTTYNDGTGIWNLGTTVLNANDSITLQLEATVSGAGKIINTSQIIKANRADIDSTPDSDD